MAQSELLFAPETAVWVVLPGDGKYTSAIVVSGTLTKEESFIRYTVCLSDTMKAFHDINDEFVIYRGNQTEQPLCDVPINRPIQEHLDDQFSASNDAVVSISASQSSPSSFHSEQLLHAHKEPSTSFRSNDDLKLSVVGSTATNHEDIRVPQQQEPSIFNTQVILVIVILVIVIPEMIRQRW